MTSIAQLDFDQIKTNLKEYLKGQTAFKDFSFEGSNMNVLLDVLAYNTFQNNFYANMATNEMFLDSAQLRDSVISHAKSLNYLPRSRTSARALLDVTLTVPNGSNPPFVVIPAKTRFSAQCGSKTFSFFTTEGTTITPTSTGVYKATALPVYEGTWITEYFKVQTSDQKFVLSNNKVNSSTISVLLKDSEDSTTTVEYKGLTSIFGSSATDKVFYLQASHSDKYELIFGLDTYGVQPKIGNVIIATYMITAGDEANDVTSFSAPDKIGGYNATVTTVSKSEGGAERESIDSIKYFAPRANQVQDRAITERDYEVLLKTRYPEIQAISVFGGEELTPPRFGRVVIAVDVKNADGVSENNKSKYAQYLADKAPVGIEPIIISPEFMYLQLNVTAYYNPKMTTMGSSDLSSKVLTAIGDYNTSSLNEFKATFRASKLASSIDALDPSMLSTDVEAIPFLPLNPTLGTSSNFAVTFGNQLITSQVLTESDSMLTYRAAVRSSTFNYAGDAVFITDDGLGKLHIVKLKDSSFAYIKKNVGTVNYSTGQVVIKNLIVNSYTGSEIKLFGRTVNPTITSPKNRIFAIRTSYTDTQSPDIAITIVVV